ncbi:unnamed protein product [Miscanthus lutarioriparius]|uniref:Golgi SNAP receptor complex member 1 n=1 Tax=Miscanthus lutarioriparius TaxID=422564 RepID=A0A811Q7M9_9POAL|nr:unnamed protein product [Miscanthus lutarioriparius]
MMSSSSSDAAAALELQESGWEELRREARKLEGDLDVEAVLLRAPRRAFLLLRIRLGRRLPHRRPLLLEVHGVRDPVAARQAAGRQRRHEPLRRLQRHHHLRLPEARAPPRHPPRVHAGPFPPLRSSHSRFVEPLVNRFKWWFVRSWKQEFRRTRGNLSSMREHADLLSSVRDDITESKATGGMSPRVHLLRERASIHGSINQIDEVIGQAQSTRVALSNQRALFGDIQGKVKQLGEKFPIIRGLLGAIKRKKSKDTIILSAVIAACTIFLIIYWLSK